MIVTLSILLMCDYLETRRTVPSILKERAGVVKKAPAQGGKKKTIIEEEKAPIEGNEDVKKEITRVGKEMKLSDEEIVSLLEIVWAESRFNPKAQNSRSSAYGLFQFLDSTWKPYGKKTSSVELQTRYGIQYCIDRYGSVEAARKFQLATISRDYTIASSRHQGRAKEWIRKGLKGY